MMNTNHNLTEIMLPDIKIEVICILFMTELGLDL